MTYGEGDDAFHLLQEEIIKKTRDDSILACGFSQESSSPTCSKSTDVLSGGVFATSPADFANAAPLLQESLIIRRNILSKYPSTISGRTSLCLRPRLARHTACSTTAL